jgi:hypothetical protein
METGNSLWSSAFSRDAPAAFVLHQIFLFQQQQQQHNNIALTVYLPITVHSGIVASSGLSPKFHPNLILICKNFNLIFFLIYKNSIFTIFTARVHQRKWTINFQFNLIYLTASQSERFAIRRTKKTRSVHRRFSH